MFLLYTGYGAAAFVVFWFIFRRMDGGAREWLRFWDFYSFNTSHENETKAKQTVLWKISRDGKSASVKN